jgi:hypothetical protein
LQWKKEIIEKKFKKYEKKMEEIKGEIGEI